MTESFEEFIRPKSDEWIQKIQLVHAKSSLDKYMLDVIILANAKETYPVLYDIIRDLYWGRQGLEEKEEVITLAKTIYELEQFDSVTQEEFDVYNYRDEERDVFLHLTKEFSLKCRPMIKQFFLIYTKFLYVNNNYQPPSTTSVRIAIQYTNGMRNYFDDYMSDEIKN